MNLITAFFFCVIYSFQYILICSGINHFQFQDLALSPESSADPLFPSFTPSISPVSSFFPVHPILSNSTIPVFSGKCPLNFSDSLKTIEKTARDCIPTLAPYLAKAVCCPQLQSLMRILLGRHSQHSGELALKKTEAEHCFSDILKVLNHTGSGNGSLPLLCSVRPLNMTTGSCPISRVSDVEQAVNATKLISRCKGVDPSKECCYPLCQSAITEAARLLLARAPGFRDPNTGGIITPIQWQLVTDCQNIIESWLARQFDPGASNKLLRNLLSCSINKECPLSLSEPSNVIATCAGSSVSKVECCSSFKIYMSSLQSQSLVTNFQALECANIMGSMLRHKGILFNIYDLCHIYLGNFSLQGCLLHYLPSDVTIDTSDKVTLFCDLKDTLLAPWSSSSLTAPYTLCSPEVSMPTLPKYFTSGSRNQNLFKIGNNDVWIFYWAFLILSTFISASFQGILYVPNY